MHKFQLVAAQLHNFPFFMNFIYLFNYLVYLNFNNAIYNPIPKI